jgi:hypothetical protein
VQEELALAQRRISDLQEEVEYLTSKLSGAESALGTYEAQLEAMEKQYMQEREILAQKQEELHERAARKSPQKRPGRSPDVTSTISLSTGTSRTQNRGHGVHSRTPSALSEANSSSSTMAALEEEFRVASEEIQKLQEELGREREQQSKRDDTIKQLQDQTIDLEIQRSKLTDDLRISMESVSILTSNLGDAEMKIKQINLELARRDAEIAKLKQDLADRSDVSQLLDDFDALSKEHEFVVVSHRTESLKWAEEKEQLSNLCLSFQGSLEEEKKRSLYMKISKERVELDLIKLRHYCKKLKQGQPVDDLEDDISLGTDLSGITVSESSKNLKDAALEQESGQKAVQPLGDDHHLDDLTDVDADSVADDANRETRPGGDDAVAVSDEIPKVPEAPVPGEDDDLLDFLGEDATMLNPKDDVGRLDEGEGNDVDDDNFSPIGIDTAEEAESTVPLTEDNLRNHETMGGGMVAFSPTPDAASVRSGSVARTPGDSGLLRAGTSSALLASAAQQQDRAFQRMLKTVLEGQVLVKHCRKSRPHPALFRISEDKKMLLWESRTEEGAPKMFFSKRKLLLSSVTKFILGQYTDVFKRQPFPEEAEFDRSFSLQVGSPNSKKSMRTVDLICPSKPSRDMWVQVLSTLISVPAEYGASMDMDKVPDARLLDEFEFSFCSRNHIFPSQYLRLKQRYLRERQRGRYLSAADFASWGVVDTFRAGKCYSFFQNHLPSVQK